MLTRYQDVRLSKHFTLLDFMASRLVTNAKTRLPIGTSFTRENARAGMHLCEAILEPCISSWGPCSIYGGFVPEPVATVALSGADRGSGYRWTSDVGAAADVVWHAQVAEGVAPIDLCHALDRTKDMHFEKLATTSGSEYVYMGALNVTEPRYALQEHRRIIGRAPEYKNWGEGWHTRRLRWAAKLPEATEDWMRSPGNKKPFDEAGFVRVGRNFMLTDFCRSESAIRDGANPVCRVGSNSHLVARMFAEALDPLVDAVGRVCVTNGGFWPMKAASYELTFLLPAETDLAAAEDTVAARIAGRGMTVRSQAHPSGALEWTVRIRHFVPGVKFG